VFNDDTGECTIEEQLMKHYGYENADDMPGSIKKITHHQYQHMLPAQDDSPVLELDIKKVITKPVEEKRVTADV